MSEFMHCKLVLFTCADCGAMRVFITSYYFKRALCAACYHEETQRSARENEIRILEQMYTRSAC